MLEMVSTQNDILAKLKLMVESVSGIAARGTAESHSDDGVQGHLQHFQMEVIEALHTMGGQAVLFKPNFDIGNTTAALKDKALLRRLESLLLHWTSQVKKHPLSKAALGFSPFCP
ncbi:hypothetical protein CVIRNUC_006801 [Coccomyxa viridis]|uniref:Uncharacterized protein n=1 Tax=Coccomyxa viridis TaxID=1274662 RepID=A0AAV1I931_9CHLO|nr:hypothetical protein CVIRNUC_006801 [Coccomyxa viridis]